MFTRLYIHIPFCRRKCPYCAFYSLENSDSGLSDYTGLLCREMKRASGQSHPEHKLASVYFGGGTPSLLEPRQVAELLEQAARLFGLAADAEITLEANPGTVDFRKLAGFRRAGVTRLSLGVQSFDDSLLQTLGRIHTAPQAREAFGAARRAGFDNIGIDLIHTLPGQTREMWLSDLQRANDLAPEHLSIYGLTVEEDTPFADRFPANSPLLPDDNLAAEMFETAHDHLAACGYEHYEIANYARPGFRSQHNSGYWKRDGYLGLGAGAHSFLRDAEHGTRFSNPADLAAYATAISKGELPRTDVHTLARAAAIAEFFFLGLRMSDGVRFSTFADEFGSSLNEMFPREIASLQEQGLLSTDDDGIRLTRRGMLFSNQVFHQFLP